MSLKITQGDTFSYSGPVIINPVPLDKNAIWSILPYVSKVVGGSLVYQFTTLNITYNNNTINLFAPSWATKLWPEGELYLYLKLTSSVGTSYTLPPILLELNGRDFLSYNNQCQDQNYSTNNIDYGNLEVIVNKILENRINSNLVKQLPLTLNSDNISILLPPDFQYLTRLIFVNGLYISPLQYTISTGTLGTTLTFNTIQSPTSVIVGVPL